MVAKDVTEIEGMEDQRRRVPIDDRVNQLEREIGVGAADIPVELDRLGHDGASVGGKCRLFVGAGFKPAPAAVRAGLKPAPTDKTIGQRLTFRHQGSA